MHLELYNLTRPFVVFMSESQAFFEESMVNLHLARRNRLPAQRDMGTGKWSFEKQALGWDGEFCVARGACREIAFLRKFRHFLSLRKRLL